MYLQINLHVKSLFVGIFTEPLIEDLINYNNSTLEYYVVLQIMK